MSIISFSNSELNVTLNAITYKGEPVFFAVEAATALGYSDPHQALNFNCKSLIRLNSVSCTELNLGDRPKGVILLKESDLYRLIMRSKLPSAEKFQDWVCDEVLPTLRSKGAYVLDSKHQVNIVENDLLLVKYTADIMKLAPSCALKMLHDVKGRYGLSVALPDYAVDAPEGYTSSPQTKSLTELLKDHGISLSAAKFYLLLAADNVVEKAHRINSKRNMVPYWRIKDEHYGKNLSHGANPQKTQCHFYVEKFHELINKVNS